jgi:exodeoxyribonuclease-5
LTYEESNRLYQEVLKDYTKPNPRVPKKRSQRIFQWFASEISLMQLRAINRKVVSGIPFYRNRLPDGINRDYIRWLYTAMSQNKLYLIGLRMRNFVE